MCEWRIANKYRFGWCPNSVWTPSCVAKLCFATRVKRAYPFAKTGHVHFLKRTRSLFKTNTFTFQNEHVHFSKRTRLLFKMNTVTFQNGHVHFLKRTRSLLKADTFVCQNGHVHFSKRTRSLLKADTFTSQSRHVHFSKRTCSLLAGVQTESVDCRLGRGDETQHIPSIQLYTARPPTLNTPRKNKGVDLLDISIVNWKHSED